MPMGFSFPCDKTILDDAFDMFIEYTVLGPETLFDDFWRGNIAEK